MLRFFRFHAWYGQRQTGPSRRSPPAKMPRHAHSHHSRENGYSDEMMELLWAARSPVPAIEIRCRKPACFTLLLPEAQSTERLARLIKIAPGRSTTWIPSGASPL